MKYGKIKLHRNEKGQAALISIILLSFVALSIALTIAFVVLNEFRGVNNIIRSQRAFHAAEAAMDDIKVQLKVDDSNWAVTDGTTYDPAEWVDYLDGANVDARITSAGYIQTITVEATFEGVKRFLFATCNFSTGICMTTEVEPS